MLAPVKKWQYRVSALECWRPRQTDFEPNSTGESVHCELGRDWGYKDAVIRLWLHGLSCRLFCLLVFSGQNRRFPTICTR